MFAGDNVFRVGGTGLAAAGRPGHRQRWRVRHVAHQGQDTRVHAERGTPDRRRRDQGGPFGRVQGGRRHVRAAHWQLAGPVAAREPERRTRRGRGQEQVCGRRSGRRRRRRRRGRPLRRVHDRLRAGRQLATRRLGRRRRRPDRQVQTVSAGRFVSRSR